MFCPKVIPQQPNSTKRSGIYKPSCEGRLVMLWMMLLIYLADRLFLWRQSDFTCSNNPSAVWCLGLGICSSPETVFSTAGFFWHDAFPELLSRAELSTFALDTDFCCYIDISEQQAPHTFQTQLSGLPKMKLVFLWHSCCFPILSVFNNMFIHL